MEQNTKKKIIIAGVAFLALLLLILLLVVVYYYVIKGRDNQSADAKLQTFPLKWGVGSSLSLDPDEAKRNVKEIQRFCNDCGCSLIVDGIWGANTEAAVDYVRRMYPQTVAFITPVTESINENSKWEIRKENLNQGLSISIGTNTTITDRTNYNG